MTKNVAVIDKVSDIGATKIHTHLHAGIRMLGVSVPVWLNRLGGLWITLPGARRGHGLATGATAVWAEALTCANAKMNMPAKNTQSIRRLLFIVSSFFGGSRSVACRQTGAQAWPARPRRQTVCSAIELESVDQPVEFPEGADE